jgi:RHS repeat-associated protein
VPAAAKWFDPVVGIDVHLVVVPPSAIPVPCPHVFLGVVLDVFGALLDAAVDRVLGGGGQVLIEGKFPGNTGTEVLGAVNRPVLPNAVTVRIDRPKGSIFSGSRTVVIRGSLAGRALSSVKTCSVPVDLPGSNIMPLPSTVSIGGPEAIDGSQAIWMGIRTKWFSNVVHKVLRIKPGSRLSKLVCFLTGHPVDVMSGAVLTDAIDFELPGALPLVFERNYCSRERHAGALGPGWAHSFEAAVFEEEKRLVVQLEDGRRVAHPWLESGESDWEAVECYSLERTGVDAYSVTYTSGRTLVFARAREREGTCPLVQVRDRNGNAIALEYASGRLSGVVDSAGRRLRFVHDGAGRLTGVGHQRAGGVALLVGFEYDDEGRLAAVRDAAGRPFRYAYRGGVLVRETNRNGLSFHFEYDWHHPDGRCTRTWGDGGILERRLTYDEHRHVTIVDDSRGGRVHYFGNAAGLVDRMIDAEGGEWRYEWDPASLRKIAEVDPLGHRQAWEYDGRGNLLAYVDALGHAIRGRYMALDLPVEVIDGRGQRWAREYDGRGNLVRASDPLGAAWEYRHDGRGEVVEVRDPLGRAVRIMRDAAGQVVALTDREGHTTRFEYDECGRLVRRIGALGGETRIEWDACGRLVSLARPDRSRIGREYDAEGNLVRRVDGLGHAWTYTYGGFNKVVSRADPLGGQVEYGYDSEENLIRVTNELGEVCTFEYDRCGRVICAVGFDGRAQTFRHDAAGRQVGVVNGRRQRVAITRDPLGRVVEQTGSDGIWSRFAYDADGAVIEAANEGSVLRFVRDACGRVVEERAGEDVVESDFDALGNRIRRRTSGGHEVYYDYDRNGALIGLRGPRKSDAPPDAPDFEVRDCWRIELVRDAEGHEVARRLPGDVEVRWERDVLGRPVVQRVLRYSRGEARELLRRRYEWRAEDRLAAIHDGERGTIRYVHDPRGALIAVEHADGRVERRAFDLAGNVFRAADRSDRVYGPGGRLRTAGRASFEYDGDGNMTRRREDDGEWHYTWDSLGQLRATNAEEFTYDALGRRIARRGEDGETRWSWDADECAEELRGGQRLAWVLGKDALPLASVSVEGEPTGRVSDLAGETIAVEEDGAVAVVWLDIFGDVDGEAIDPWRWPGQYAEDGLGLVCNGFRFYDPELGVYLSQDPAWADLRAYGYVLDPLGWCDPLGLELRTKMLREALAVLRKHDRSIKELFGEDVRIGIRGSLSTGIKHSTGGPFNPRDFDVDAFVVSRRLGNGWPERLLGRKAQRKLVVLEILIGEDLRIIPEFEKVRLPFGFRVWERQPSGSTMSCGR